MNTILKLKDDHKLSYLLGGSALAAILTFYAFYKMRNTPKTLSMDESDTEIHEINDRLLYEYFFIEIKRKHF